MVARTHPVEQALLDCLLRQRVQGQVTIALSGGIDSMVLLDAMHRVLARASTAAAPMSIDALHVHHGLSPHADAWAQFCQQQCEARAIRLAVVPVKLDRMTTDGQGVEGAARIARYAAFGEHAAPTLLAAQHADDQAETVLHQMLRGTGLAGLAAMGEVRILPSAQRLLRPLLALGRADIADYADAYDVAWISDESNDDTAFTRNFIRHDVMPLLERRFPHAAASLRRTARHAAESVEMLQALASLDLAWDGATAHADALDQLSRARQTNALYHWLRWQGVIAPSQAQLEEWAAQLFRVSPPDKPHQAGGHDFIIQRRAGLLKLVRRIE